MAELERAQAYALIDSAHVARLAQLDSNQQVHAIPFVFSRVDGHLFSPVDGKPKRHGKLARLRWLETNPNVTVLIDHYAVDWSTLWWLRIYGPASAIDSSHVGWAQAVAALKEKYPQYRDISMFHDNPTMLCFKLERWKYWSAR